MKVGTKSVLFGAHCFFLHPIFVAWAWYQLYGFRPVQIGYATGHPTRWYWRWPFQIRGGPVFASLWHPALWLAFIVHDLGYLGKPNMDGPEGEEHPEFGARILRAVFPIAGTAEVWYRFVRYHSRYLAAKDDRSFSYLCVADKLAIALTPAWLYLPMVTATGEIHEYLKNARARGQGGEYSKSGLTINGVDPAKWYADLGVYMRKWVEEHKNCGPDRWTPKRHDRVAITESGVTQ